MSALKICVTLIPASCLVIFLFPLFPLVGTIATANALGLDTPANVKKRAVGMPQQPTSEPVYVRYTPVNGSAGSESGITQRLVRIQEAPVDPLAPPKFKRKKLPGAPPSPPGTVLRSPPRKATKEELEEWKIPAAISNWTNSRGYIIALDKRVAMDGHMMEDFRPSEKFAQVTEALALAEEAGRLEIEARNKIRRRLEEQKREEEERILREQAIAARQATLERASLDEEEALGMGYGRVVKDEQERERETLRREREEEIRRDMRRRPVRERDISERVALNQSLAGVAGSGPLYDERLFHQDVGGTTAGMGGEGVNDQYDTALFSAGGIGGVTDMYRPTSDAGKLNDATFAEANLAAITAASASSGRKPVQFERDGTTSGEANTGGQK